MITHLLEEITKLPERCRRIHCMFRNLLKGGSLSHFLPIELLENRKEATMISMINKGGEVNYL
jgi:hypothetical protein